MIFLALIFLVLYVVFKHPAFIALAVVCGVLGLVILAAGAAVYAPYGW